MYMIMLQVQQDGKDAAPSGLILVPLQQATCAVVNLNLNCFEAKSGVDAIKGGTEGCHWQPARVCRWNHAEADLEGELSSAGC